MLLGVSSELPLSRATALDFVLILFMMARFVFCVNTVIFGVLLLGGTLAGRLNDVARRRGFHPQALRDLAARSQGVEESSSTKNRYLNQDTESGERCGQLLHGTTDNTARILC